MAFPTSPTNGLTATVNNISFTWNSSKGVWIKAAGGIQPNSISALAITGTTTVNSSNSATAIANGGTNGVGNIGASGSTFNTIFAKSTTAQYADLAENYVADAEYSAGTVVEFGGIFEITQSSDASTRVAGIISENPAYLMNSQAQGNYVLPVALQGRVNCKVKGSVKKGSMLISAGNGYACANEDPKVGTVIGKSLADFDGDEGIIEVVVGKN
jgi:hypothetical protein